LAAPPGDETEISGNVAKGADSGLREATPTPPHSVRDMWVPPLLRLARCECRDEAFTPDERVCLRRAEGRSREKKAGAAVPRIVVTSRVIINVHVEILQYFFFLNKRKKCFFFSAKKCEISD